MRSSPAAATAVTVLVLVALQGCGTPPRTPVLAPFGATFNDTTVPVDVTFDRTSLGSLEGRASSTSLLHVFFPLFSWGDCSVAAAADAGGITRVHHVDARVYNFLGFIQRYETIVYGE